jgi:hypothetical protein
VNQALLFLTDLASAPFPAQTLDAALKRMEVTAAHRQIVSLSAEPELGARWQIRVTPCVVLDTGSRHLLLPGDPDRLDAARLERALAQR